MTSELDNHQVLKFSLILSPVFLLPLRVFNVNHKNQSYDISEAIKRKFNIRL